jgi:hypothetical protein
MACDVVDEQEIYQVVGHVYFLDLMKGRSAERGLLCGKGSAATLSLVPETIQMGIRPPNSRTIQVLSPASRRLLLRSVKLQIVRYEVSCRTGVLSVELSAAYNYRSPEKQTLVLGVRYQDLVH